ncbi:MAG: thiamine pyrophosphate-dependent enzyme, partial [Anaerolineaceae bacterium]
IPMLEPADVQSAYSLMLGAFDLSEKFNLPVVVRVIHALTVDEGVISVPASQPPARQPGPFARQKDRWTVLPVQVVPLHQKLQQKMCAAAGGLAAWPHPLQSGSLNRGVITAGYAWSKLGSVLKNGEELALPVLGLEVLNPLPAGRIAEFVAGLDEVLVVEETAPVIETAVRSIAQQERLPVKVKGRMTGHLLGAGELDTAAIAAALQRMLPDWPGPRLQPEPRSMISRKSLCEGCPYIPVYDALKALMEQHGGRDQYVVTGETGCLVRGQLPPWEMLDVKYSMGSSIGIASGMQRAGIPHRPVVLSGDSAFLHNGFGELIDAVHSGRDLLVIILDNNVTALTGGQPHPATQQEGTRGPSTQVNLESLIRAAGVEWLRLVDPLDEGQLKPVLEEGLQTAGVRVIISRSPCVLYQA